MGRGRRGRGGGRGGQGGRGENGRWSRKRKVEERQFKVDKERTDNGMSAAGYIEGKDYTPTPPSNPKMEAYYSLLGLHSTRYEPPSAADDAENARSVGKFVPCLTDEEKHAERNLFMSTLRSILPASFRIDRSLDLTIQQTLLEELQQFVGKEMELEIELPKRSEAFGGMKDILERGKGRGRSGEKECDDNVENQKREEKQTQGQSSEMKDLDADAITSENDLNEDHTIKSEHSANTNVTIVKKTIAPAKPIPFVSQSFSSPDHTTTITTLGYQLSVDRRTLRRNPSLLPFHQWLKIQTDCGHITRQETVSMIPPIVLDPKDGMSVLDMCAAPGSKTCQLLEVVGGFINSSSSTPSSSMKADESDLEPSGYVVANDADSKRAYMLVNQLRRMNSPNVFVTSCDGQYFPILDENGAKGTDKEGMFDRGT